MNQNMMRQQLSKLNHKLSFSIYTRSMGTGSRGARGHGWLHKYRAGEGGRHLQGRYHNRDIQKLTNINNQVFALNESHKDKVKIPCLAYLDIAVDEGGLGNSAIDQQQDSNSKSNSNASHRIVIELASAALPNTCRNFVDLCQAHNGDDSINRGYKSSRVYKILPQVGLCLGDITERNNGKQGKCSPNVVPSDALPNTHTFPHETTVISHAEKGIVTMLSTGVDKNDSRFMIMTADDAPHLDGRMVAFGRVKEGMDALQEIVNNTYTKRGEPTVNIQIVGCGTL